MASYAVAQDRVMSGVLGKVLLITISFVCIVLSGFVRIPVPFTPVPVTVQTLFVILCAGMVGGSGAVWPAALYIAAGCAGLPVFSTSIPGCAYMMGPTGGYMAGFLAASVIMGWAVPRSGGSFLRIALAGTCAAAAILACGMAWLVLGCRLPLHAAFFAGGVPFIIPDMVKVSIAAAFLARIKPQMQRSRGV